MLHAVEVNLDGVQRLDADRKGEPVNKYRERRLDCRPERTDDGALVGFDKLIFRQKKNLLAKALVFFPN